MSCCNPLRESFRATKLQTVVEVESVDVECYTLCHIRDIIKKAVLGRPCPFKKEWRSLIICCKGTSFIQYFQICFWRKSVHQSQVAAFLCHLQNGGKVLLRTLFHAVYHVKALRDIHRLATAAGRARSRNRCQ